MKGPLTPAQVEEFHRNGFVAIEKFYDLQKEIEPIQRGIHDIIGTVLERHGLPVRRTPFSAAAFDADYSELIKRDRKHGSEVYDAVKMLGPFLQLVASSKHHAAFAQLRADALPGIPPEGQGIRIDLPGEDRFLAPWHQDYTTNFRSLDGIVFWGTLVPITPEMGPVEYCVGSHKDGVAPLRLGDPKDEGKHGTYGMTLDGEKDRIKRYPKAAPLCKPGDVIIADYLVLHTSGRNRGARARWSMQMRYFNFKNADGVRTGWRGAAPAKASLDIIDTLRSIHPEFLIE